MSTYTLTWNRPRLAALLDDPLWNQTKLRRLLADPPNQTPPGWLVEISRSLECLPHELVVVEGKKCAFK